MYGDAIQQAGMVKARANGRDSTSDFLAMEKERGISISSTCLTFEYGGARINLMDTPGHADFSEDTYRTLSAADNAVMLVDGGKGLAPTEGVDYWVLEGGEPPPDAGGPGSGGAAP